MQLSRFFHSVSNGEKVFAACTFLTAITHYLIGQHNFRTSVKKDRGAQLARNYWNWAAFQRGETGVLIFFPILFPFHVMNQFGLAMYGLFCNHAIKKTPVALLTAEEADAAYEHSYNHVEAQHEANLRGKVPCSIQGASGEVLAVNQSWFTLLKCPKKMGAGNAWMIGVPKEWRTFVRESWFSYIESAERQKEVYRCRLPWLCPETKERIGLSVIARPLPNGCFVSELTQIDLRDVPSLVPT